MRSNEQKQKAFASSSQLNGMNVNHSVADDHQTILSMPVTEYDVPISEVKLLKKQMSRS